MSFLDGVRLIRSLLLVPGDAADRLASAAAAGADVLVLDLAATPPASAKPQARTFVAETLRTAGRSSPRCRLFVRINSLSSQLAELDLDAVMPGRPDGIVLPETVGGADLSRLGAMLAVREAEHGLLDGATRIIAMISSGRGILGLGSLAGATRRLVAVGWDAPALGADLRVLSGRDPTGEFTDPFRLARSLTLFGAGAAGVAAIDTPPDADRGLETLAAESRAARRDGFAGKVALAPDQVPVITAAFAGPIEGESSDC